MIYTNTYIWGEKKQEKIIKNINEIKNLIIDENNKKNNENFKNENEKIKNQKIKNENKIEGELYMGEITTSSNDGFFHIAYDDGIIYI